MSRPSRTKHDFVVEQERARVVRRHGKPPPEPVVPFTIANCVVPRRLIALVEHFLLDNRTGNISLNIKDGEILGAHVEEIVGFRGQNF